ncbi:hypothetical protein GCM10020358_56140 [Amorphoplanes nipponensis]|uniref:Uncharacterized protein n=1 Tax=Actinoplanes nipponensis TaxID=135950 RepID=A0A919MPC0_9ACTN|nr:DUF6232 family protein [Actinoplanes nipponensis]GIE51892.1 hypothetical protein Ani05nite_54260 [Actinoplanes nipponensis]
MRTYYRGTDAVVTDGHFVWLGAPARTALIRDLRNVRRVHRAGPRGLARPLHIAFAALVVTAAGWTTLGTPAVYISAPLCAAIAGMSTAAYWRLRPQRWELLATYRGTEMTLYATTDVRVFNQVARALRRAVEDTRPVSDGHHLVAA